VGGLDMNAIRGYDWKAVAALGFATLSPTYAGYNQFEDTVRFYQSKSSAKIK
jgi:hypothetical protein